MANPFDDFDAPSTGGVATAPPPANPAPAKPAPAQANPFDTFDDPRPAAASPGTQVNPFDAFDHPQISAEELAQRDNGEIAAHAAEHPEDFETAYQADKLRRARPWTQQAWEGVKAFPGGLWHGLQGLGRFAAGAVETPLHALEWWKPSETKLAENTLAAQHGEQAVTSAGNAIMAARPTAYSGGWGEEDYSGGNDLTPEAQEEHDRAVFAQRVQQAKNELQLSRGQPLDTGAIAGIYHLASQQPSEEVGPEALKAAGVPQADLGTVSRMSAASDPTMLALSAAPGLPGAAKVGGAITEGAGKVASGVGTALNAANNYIPHFGAKGTIVGLAGRGLAAMGDVLEQQGKEARTGLPSALTTEGATAAATGKSALGANLQRTLGDAAAHGATTAVGMAPLNALLAQGDPTALGESTAGAAVFGGALGTIQRNRPMMVEAVRPFLRSEGVRALTEAGQGNDPLAAKSQAYLMSLPPEARDRALEAVGAIQGLPTNTPDGQVRAKLYVLNDSDYKNVIEQKFGMQQAAMGGGRGFYIGDDGAAYVNGDYHSGLDPTELSHTVGHEFGGHAAVNIMQAMGAKGGELYNGLIGSAKQALMPNGQPTADFYQFVKRYNLAFDPTGQTQRLDFRNPEAIDEFIAEQAGQLMAAKGAGELALPKTIQDKISDGLGRYLGKVVGVDTDKVGTPTHFGREEVGKLSKLVQDTLGQVVGMKLRGGAEIPEPAKTDTTRISELQATLNTPRPKPGSPLEEVRQWISDQKAARSELSSLQQGQTGAFPASGQPPVPPSAPQAPNVPAPAPTPSRASVAAALRINGISAAEAQQWAQQAQGSTVEEMVLDALKRRAGQKFPSQPPVAQTPPNQPAPIPPAEKTPANVTSEPQPSTNATGPNDLPPEPTRTAVIPAGPPAAEEPAPLQASDVDKIAAQAEQAVRAGRTARHKAETLPKAITDAQVDAVAAAHEASVPANYQGVKLRRDALGKETISGTFNPSRPFDAFLLKQADLSQKHVGILQDLQGKIGQTVTVNYGHAPEGEETVTAGSRRKAQGESTAQARASGEAATQNEEKNIVPLTVQFNKGSDTPSITILGASPEKLLSNFNHLAKTLTEFGEPVPYRDIHDPHLVADMKGVARNHANGWKADGSAKIEGFPDVNVPKADEGYTPYQIPKDRADFINIILGDESAKSSEKGATPTQKLKQGLAAKNNIAMNAAGEVNGLRDALNAAKGPITGQDGKTTTWSKATIENPLSEALRVDLINEVKPELNNADESIREHGYKGDIGRFFAEGSPDRTFTAAGFMPDTGTPKTAKEKARERIAAREVLPNSANGRFMPDDRERPMPEGFYSQLQRTLEAKMPNSAPAAQVLAIARGGAKAEELKWSDIDGAVKRIADQNGGKVPKQALLDYLNTDGAVRFKETTLSDEKAAFDPALLNKLSQAYSDRNTWRDQMEAKLGDPRDWPSAERIELSRRTAAIEDMERQKQEQASAQQSAKPKFSQYTVPGGTNYREVVLTMPEKQDQSPPTFQSSHYPDAGNYVAHMRLADHTDAQGRDGTLIEEEQSDRHQQGREKGYREDKDAELNRLLEERKSPDDSTARAAQDRINELGSGDVGVPDAPLRKTWHEYLFRRALQNAVEDGKQWIGWTNGETQAARYDLSKQVDRLEYGANSEELIGYKDGQQILRENVPPSELSDHIGKDAAKLIADQVNAKPSELASLEGDQLKVGGHGMAGFYDNILPKYVDSYVKKWGGKVEAGSIDPTNGEPYHVIEKGGKWVQLHNGNVIGTFDTKEEALNDPETPIWKVDITPAIREAVKAGQPMFMPSTDGTPSTGEPAPEGQQPSGSQPDRPLVGGTSQSLPQKSFWELMDENAAKQKAEDATITKARLDGTERYTPAIRLEDGKVVKSRSATEGHGELSSLYPEQKVEHGFVNNQTGKFMNVLEVARERGNFMPDTGKPEEGETPGERLMREAEAAGLAPSLDTIKGVLKGDQAAFDKLRAMIKDRTGAPARFMPGGTPQQRAQQRLQQSQSVPAPSDDRKRRDAKQAARERIAKAA